MLGECMLWRLVRNDHALSDPAVWLRDNPFQSDSGYLY